MKKHAQSAVMALVGLVVTLAWWTIRGPGPSDDPSVKEGRIPPKVFGGGGGVVTIEAEANAAAVVSASFETNDSVGDANHKFIETWQRVPAGAHAFSVDVPADVGGTIEVRIDDAAVGAEAKVRLKVKGDSIAEAKERLDQPLEPGYGFAAQVEVEDCVTGKASAN